MNDIRLGYRFKNGEGYFFGVDHESEAWHPLDNVNLLRLILNLVDGTNDVEVYGSLYGEERFGVFFITVNDREYSKDEVLEECEFYGVVALTNE